MSDDKTAESEKGRDYFLIKHNIEVRIAVEIQVESPVGFDDTTQRAVLKFDAAGFEEE